jgi:hypothetical protein
MTNQHAGLSQVLAEQRITERRHHAAHARLGRGNTRRVAGGHRNPAGTEPPLRQPRPATLPASSTATTTQHSPKTGDDQMRHPFITAQLLRQHEPRPLLSCQPAVSDRAQAQVNQEGTTPTARRTAGRDHPRTKKGPCRDSLKGLC